MSPGYLRISTGIPVGKPVGIATCGSESLTGTGQPRSGYAHCIIQVPVTGTHKFGSLLVFRDTWGDIRAQSKITILWAYGCLL